MTHYFHCNTTSGVRLFYATIYLNTLAGFRLLLMMLTPAGRRRRLKASLSTLKVFGSIPGQVTAAMLLRSCVAPGLTA